MTCVNSYKQRSTLGLLLPLFQYKPQIKGKKLSVEYKRFTGGKFLPRKFGFKNISDLLLKLNVFDHHGPGNRLVSLSEAKLLDVLVRPLLSLRSPPNELELAFVRANGFTAKLLCHYFKVETFSQLLDKCTAPANPPISQPSSSTLAPPSAPPTPAATQSQAPPATS